MSQQRWHRGAVVLSYAVALTLFIIEAGLVPNHVDLWSFHSYTLTVPYSFLLPFLLEQWKYSWLTYHDCGRYNISITHLCNIPPCSAA